MPLWYSHAQKICPSNVIIKHLKGISSKFSALNGELLITYLFCASTICCTKLFKYTSRFVYCPFGSFVFVFPSTGLFGSSPFLFPTHQVCHHRPNLPVPKDLLLIIPARRIACVFGAIDKSGFISFSGESCRSFPGVGNDTFVYFITIITATCIVHHLFISLVSRISSDYSKIKRFFQTDRFFGIFCPEEIYFSSFFNWA